MAPKKADKEKKEKKIEKEEVNAASVLPPSPPPLLDKLFPKWGEPVDGSNNDNKNASGNGKYVDSEGRTMPKTLLKVVDAWKRPEELVAGMPDIPVFSDLTSPTGESSDDGNRSSGMELYAGSSSLEWLLSVFVSVKTTVVEVQN